ncbi:DUF499 domain-containing protein [Haloferax marisrubri]|uniref:DUF499 domain-containing protein n=2 Tax=Haloferax marisrubri TaxID=1544719 RepID=A0A2P4NLE0_9EURY|nr:DUF499 domain-containing protein [Haloferax marisrubri]
MWGEIAYQLYGHEGYEQIREKYDETGSSPGENTLQDLFALSDDPVLILIDELAQYLEDASSVSVTDTTLSNQTLSFVKSLLETASSTPHVNIVYSIADTAFTDEAETIRREIKELDSIEQRQRRTITPTGSSEVSSVLQHRLFDEIDQEASKNVADAYYEYYRDVDRGLPQNVQEPAYRDRLESDYPLHPSIVDTLTQKIDSIQDFQKTRDALRLLARGIYYLWENGSKNQDRHFLRLYDLTPADDAPSGSIRTKLSDSLFEAVDLSAAVSADIYSSDGTAHGQREDGRWLDKDLPAIGSHITIVTLWNSLAVGERAIGLTRDELYEALAHPGISFDHYDSALKNLTGNDPQSGCYYLYDRDRLKFKSEAKLLYIIDQYTRNTPRKEAKDRFEGRLRREIGTGGLQTVPTTNPDDSFPEEPADVSDNADQPTLVIPHFDSVTVSDGGEEIPSKINTLYNKTASSHGAPTQTRKYKNYVLFLVPDAELVSTGIEKARRMEGIERLLNDSEKSAELTDDQFEDLRERRKTHRGLLGEQVRNVYRHLFYPDRGGLEHVAITAVDANGDSSFVKAVEATLDDRILRDDSDARGEVWFKQRLWQSAKNRMSTQQLKEQFAKKPGLPFLFSTKPLRKTVSRMVTEAGYVYWDNTTQTAYWTGSEEPDNWTHDGALTDSEDVKTSIKTNDVRIGDDYYLYKDIESLVDQESITPPTTGTDDETGGSGGTGSTGGTDETGGTDDGTGGTDDGDTVETWSHTSNTASAKRAFSEVREEALAKAGNNATPTVESVSIEVSGDEVLKHAFFLAQTTLSDYTDHTTVSMIYRARGGDDEFKANFNGSLASFNTLNQRLEGFADKSGQRNVDLTFTLSLPSPEEISTEDETDVLAVLRDKLSGTDVTLQVEGSGDIDTEDDA